MINIILRETEYVVSANKLLKEINFHLFVHMMDIC